MMTDAEAIDTLRRKFNLCPDPRISTPERVLQAVDDAILEAGSCFEGFDDAGIPAQRSLK